MIRQAKLGERCRGRRQQPLFERGIAPGAGRRSRPDQGAGVPLVALDHAVHRVGLQDALLEQQRFERPHPRNDVGIDVRMVLAHPGTSRAAGRAGPASRQQQRLSSYSIETLDINGRSGIHSLERPFSIAGAEVSTAMMPYAPARRSFTQAANSSRVRVPRNRFDGYQFALPRARGGYAGCDA